MAGTFNMMRANDLIWSFVVNNYLMGKDPFPFDLLYWNSDSTRMPAAMHSFYLRTMYMENRLVEPGGIEIDGTFVERCVSQGLSVVQGDGLCPQVVEALFERGNSQCLVQFARQAFQHRRGHVFRGPDAKPDVQAGPLDAHVGIGRGIREEGGFAVAGHAQQLDLAASDVREGNARIEHEVGLAGQHILQGRG